MKFMECAVRDVIYGTNVRIVKPANIYFSGLERRTRHRITGSPFP